MEILAHGGANWTPNAVDTQHKTGQTAVAVGRTVLIYKADGEFESELRATGHGRVQSVNFCKSPALTHLLAVATQNHIRIFDTISRRHFRSNVETTLHAYCKKNARAAAFNLFTVRFVPGLPYLVHVFLVDGHVFLLRVAKHDMHVVSHYKLPVMSLTSVCECTNLTGRTFVSGIKDASGILLTVRTDGRKPMTSSAIHTGTQITHISATANPHQNGTRVRLACVNARMRTAQIFESLDAASTWTVPQAAEQPAPSERTSKLHASCAWVGGDILVTSHARGGLTVWRVGAGGRTKLLTERPSAHGRQVWAMAGGRAITTVSGDRTVASWAVTGLHEDACRLQMCWRSTRTSGSVPVVRAVAGALVWGVGRGAFGGVRVAGGVAAAATWRLGEAEVSGSVLGRRGRDGVLLAGCGAFCRPDGRVGVLAAGERLATRETGRVRADARWFQSAGSLVCVSACGALSELAVTGGQACLREGGRVAGGGAGILAVGVVRVRGCSAYVVSGRDGGLEACGPGWNARLVLRAEGEWLPAVCSLAVAVEVRCTRMAFATVCGGVWTCVLEGADWAVGMGDCVLQVRLVCRRASRVVRLMEWAPGAQDGRLVSVGAGECVEVWESRGGGTGAGARLGVRAVLKEHFGGVVDVQWLSDDVLVTAGDDGTVRKWCVSRLPVVCAR